ncbi:MAG TPA: DUF2490 domain-containing protein [Thermoanaerobaculia bacterium]|jgi:hypothetical protein
MSAERLFFRWRSLPRVLACAFALLALTGRVSAQQTEDFGVWLGGFVNGKLPPSLNSDRGAWRLWMDVQVRFGDDASRFAQGLLRPGIGYALGGGWTIWAGYAYIRTEPPYAASTTTENRIWEQATWAGAIGATALSSRTRLEQRFVSTGRETGWRLREFIKGSRPLASQSIWYAVVSDEFFVNLNSTDFGATAGSDRNRFFVGPGARLSKAVSVEIGYLNQYTFRANGPDKNDHLLATNLFWSY